MVKPHGWVLVVLVLLSAFVLPAFAQTDIYDNGPINGTNDSWTINFGFVVSDSFTIANDNTTVTGLTFGAFVLPGDTVQSVEISITSNEAGGTTYFDQVVNFTQENCFVNQYGFNVCNERASFDGPTLSAGSYWLNLQNAVVDTGDPVYWDENSGVGCQSFGCPSSASESSIGTIPSESFTLFGRSGSGTGTTPEPASLVLFSSGLLAVASMIRRRLL
jgi:hypothetical protein